MTACPPIVVLLGLRASGKTTLGRALAERLGRRFIDLDDRTRALLGDATIADAFRRVGESGFRSAEVEALAGALDESGIVLALGGGTPTAPGAAAMLRKAQAGARAAVVYLRCDPELLRGRLRDAGGAGANRPSLTGADPLDEIEQVHAARDPVYRALADVVLEGEQSAPSIERALASR
ncbi:MAG: shikimate kinase [Phycisphaerales bacterium]